MKLRWTDGSDDRCPGCGVFRELVLRYPRAFCGDCHALAVDSNERQLEFFNTHPLGGGFGFRWRGEDATYSAGGVIAHIQWRVAYFREARFGGVVAQVEEGVPANERRGLNVDLTRLGEHEPNLTRIDLNASMRAGFSEPDKRS